MILTCPSCGTQYAVKDGAIPPQGRQVRCASCKHSWHQDPEQQGQVREDREQEVRDSADTGQAETEDSGETIPEAAMIEPRSGPEAEQRAYVGAALADQTAEQAAEGHGEPGDEEQESDSAAGFAPIDPVAPPAEGLVESAPAAPVPPVQPIEADARSADEDDSWTPPADAADDEFSPFPRRETEEPRRRGPLLTILLVALLIAALAAAFWFLAPAEWKQRVGIAGAGETPLQLMMTHSDRQKLASGNELLAVSGRVINPTDEAQNVPPIQAQLRSSTGQLVYSWTIAPPARTLPPGASATFNSAEVNVPAGGEELTITLGSVKT